MVTSRHYSSAFAGPQNKSRILLFFRRIRLPGYSPGNFTQLFFNQFHHTHLHFKKKKKIEVGVFSQYHALDTARQALIPIRRLYPKACIREYQEGKLGPIIDMNIDHRINDKTYDAR